MWPVATDGMAWSVCVNPAKTDKPIEMPFGQRRTHVGATNHVAAVHTAATWRIRYTYN